MGLRRLLAPALALVGLGLMAAPAHAVFHLVKVTEAMPGTVNPSAEFVELRMYAPGQEFVAGHTVTLYSSASIPTGTCTFGGSVANGDDQRSILVATAAAVSEFGVTADCALTDANRLSPAGGAACWENLDCVAWGSIAGAATLPSPVGTPAPAIAAGASLTRSTAPGCPTLLEVSDDTNNSAADFALAVPSPANNAAPAAGSACTGGGGGGGRHQRPRDQDHQAAEAQDLEEEGEVQVHLLRAGLDLQVQARQGRLQGLQLPVQGQGRLRQAQVQGLRHRPRRQPRSLPGEGQVSSAPSADRSGCVSGRPGQARRRALTAVERLDLGGVLLGDGGRLSFIVGVSSSPPGAQSSAAP